jgi:transposase-like protein
MCHRIREAKTQAPIQRKLKGIVEADETYIGGKEKNKHKSKRTGIRGRGATGKTPVFALVERTGELRAWKVKNVTGKTLKIAIRDNVDKGAVVMTDGFKSYRGLNKEFADHQVVEHGHGEYRRGLAHVNTLEGWFALLKRGVVGTFHHVSAKHLPRYINEFAFRYNRRKLTDADRTFDIIKGAFGKRLIYKDTVAIHD